MNIIRPNDASAVERAVTGGKGSSLARLVHAGFDVPPFFVVSIDAFRATVDGAPSAELLDQLRAAYDEIGGDSIQVAARSSAASEDAEGGSSAGLYETYLAIESFDALVDAVRKCWASLDNAHARQYRSDHHQESDGGGMAVVVQRFIEGDWSGVTFTSNPVSQFLSQMVVNVVPGRGEVLVAGEVNPEEIVLRSSDGTVLQRSTGESGASLPADLIKSVWQQCRSIDEKFGFPQDVEWTILDGHLYLLQSRPIATATGVFYNRQIEPWRENPDGAEDPEALWTRAYGDEVWSSPESTLNYSVRSPLGGSAGWFGVYLPMHGDTRPLPSVCAKYYMAAAYANVDLLKRIYEYHPKFARIGGVVNFFPASMHDEIRTMKWNWKGRLQRHKKLEWTDRTTTSIRTLHKHLKTLEPPLIAASDSWFELDLDAMSIDELRRHLAEDVMGQVAIVGYFYGVAVMYHSFDHTFVLTGLLDRWFGNGDSLYAAVSSGLPDSQTVAEAQAIWELSTRIRNAGPDVIQRVRDSTWADLASVGADQPAVLAIVDQFKAFLRNHRHRGAAYKDIMYHRWGDRPDMLLDMVKAGIDSAADSPVTQNAVQQRERMRQQAELMQRVRWRPLRRVVLKTLFKYNEIYMAIRNDHRFYFDRLWFARRRVYLSMGRRLVTQGVLEHEDDVFFLGTNEIADAMAGQLDGAEVRRRMAVRKADWERTLMTQAPKFLKGYSAMPDVVRSGEDASTLIGIAASPGVVRGTARVIHRIEELTQVQDGDILVTRQTDPGWTPVFTKIAGLVLETGGVLAHGTSLCREYGLPCVTVIERASNRIPDGSLIEIDGSNGTVRLLQPTPSVAA